MAYGNLNVDTITGSGASSVIVNNGSANVAGFTTGNNLQMLQNGGGIVFSNSSALTNSTLNDYETGTWTPVINGTNLGAVGVYTKIGRTVFVSFNNQTGVAATSNGTQYTITGLPFSDGGDYSKGAACNITFNSASRSYIDSICAGRVGSGTTVYFTNVSGYSSTTSDAWNLGAVYTATF